MVQFDVKRVQKGTESFMVSFDFNKTPIAQIVDYILIAASKYGTSDLHFDPRSEGMMIRFRIDGDCQDYTFVPKVFERNLTTRIKIMANMNITESRLPQDGAIKGTFGDTYLDMRVSCLPLNCGEKVVIRILDLSRSNEGIDTLGFHPSNLEKIKRMMNLPNGIILTTGATGSGKSTTTYAILNGLNKPETNIITVEDPIEMNIEGINQVQVNAEIGMTFAAALRSILRQDPNIILIGEIRDSETAQIAVRSAITGHLVLSTIHTNNALATVERLLDMNVERYLLSTALSGIISQRLAKMLCPDCRYQRDTTKYEKKVFKKYMKMDVEKVWDANPNGCEHCRKGYHGRLAFHEVLELDETIRESLSNEKMDKKELAKMVYNGNTITMLQDALIKCLDGKVSFEEVYKNIEIENEDDDNYESEMANEIRATIPVDTTGKNEESEEMSDTSSTSEVAIAAANQPALSAEDFAEGNGPVALDTAADAVSAPVDPATVLVSDNDVVPVTETENGEVVQQIVPSVMVSDDGVVPIVPDPTNGVVPVTNEVSTEAPAIPASIEELAATTTPEVATTPIEILSSNIPEVATTPFGAMSSNIPEVATTPFGAMSSNIPTVAIPAIETIPVVATNPVEVLPSSIPEVATTPLVQTNITTIAAPTASVIPTITTTPTTDTTPGNIPRL